MEEGFQEIQVCYDGEQKKGLLISSSGEEEKRIHFPEEVYRKIHALVLNQDNNLTEEVKKLLQKTIPHKKANKNDTISIVDEKGRIIHSLSADSLQKSA